MSDLRYYIKAKRNIEILRAVIHLTDYEDFKLHIRAHYLSNWEQTAAFARCAITEKEFETLTGVEHIPSQQIILKCLNTLFNRYRKRVFKTRIRA
jgi:hypothetical protein